MARIVNIDGLYAVEGVSQPQTPEYSVLALGRPGYIHAASYQEAVEMVYFGLLRAGKRVVLAPSIEACHETKWTIVIGAHLLAPMQFPVLPESAIIFNTENLASTWIDASYWIQLQRFQVW